MTTAVQQRVKMKNLDVAIGAVVAGFSLAQLNVLIGIICGTITAGILALRLRREWRHRNDPPEK